MIYMLSHLKVDDTYLRKNASIYGVKRITCVNTFFLINYAAVIFIKPNNETIKCYHLIPEDHDKHMH